MKCRRLLAVASASVVLLCTSLGITGAAHAATGSTSNFWIHCPYTGISATMDPIVDPGSTTTGHFHDFFGNTAVNPNSTPDSLRAAGIGATSCSTSTDTASYWAPSLTLGPGEVQTYGPTNFPCTVDAAGLPACHYSNIRAYYSTGGSTRSSLQVLPGQMEAIGGDHTSTVPQPLNHVGWACGGSSPFEQYPYDCSNYISLGSDQDGVVMRILFPRCWDGTGTAVADFAYPTSGTSLANCPAGFGVGLPLLNVRFHTGIVNPCLGELDLLGQQVSCSAGSTVPPNFGFELADGSMMSWTAAHADFMNGWQMGDSASTDNLGGEDDLVQDCLILALPCPVNPHTTPTSNMPS